MHKLPLVLFQMLTMIFVIGTIQNPAFAAGALYDAQNKQSQEMVVQLDGTVSNKLQQDTIYFISGNFSKAKLNDNPMIDRQNMIILNLHDQRFAYWQIDTDGPVFDMVINNNLLMIGGSYSTVDGKIQQNIALFDINSQKQRADFSGSNAPVNSLEQYENFVFMGGSFTQVSDSERLRLASFDTESNTITSWNPDINGTVNDMMVYEDRLYVVGEFTKVSGVERTYAASFPLPSGELTQWKVEATAPIRKISVQNNTILIESYAQPVLRTPIDTTDVEQTAVVSTIVDRETSVTDGLIVDQNALGFKIPTLGDVLTFTIRGFFAVAGLVSLFYLLRGALAWITSGGDKDSVADARNRIQAAVIGMILIVAVLGIVWTLEQVIFNRRICLGLSCPLTLPALLEPISN